MVQVIVGALMVFVLYRVILEVLGPEQLGVWSIVLATVSVSRIGDLGISASVTRFVARDILLPNGSGRASSTIQTAALAVAGLLAVVVCAAYPALYFLFPHLFPSSVVAEARALLPYALTALLLGSVAAVFRSGLDGCQRYDRRAALVLSGQFLYLVFAVALVRRHGLMGLAWVEIGQATFLLVAGWLVLKKSLPGLPVLPLHWSTRSFKKICGYGLQIQLGSIAMMLFEPLTKGLLGKFGGLTSAAYYQIASQFVGKLRQIITSGNQVIVPLTSQLEGGSTQRLENLYAANIKLLTVIAPPLFALAVAWSPLLSRILIGSEQSSFIVFTVILAVPMGINLFANPAYFSNLGTGRVWWNTVAHILMGTLNGVLGFALGLWFGTYGVVIGMAIAMIAGSLFVVFGFHQDNNLSWRMFFPEGSGLLLLLSIITAVAGIGISRWLVQSHSPSILMYSAWLLISVVPLILAMWKHPLFDVFLDSLLQRSGRKKE